MSKLNKNINGLGSGKITEEVALKMQEANQNFNDGLINLHSKLKPTFDKFSKAFIQSKDSIQKYSNEHKNWKEELKAQFLLKESKLSVTFEEQKIISAETPNDFLFFWLWYYEMYFEMSFANFDTFKIKSHDFILFSEYEKIRMKSHETKSPFDAMEEVFDNFDKRNKNRRIEKENLITFQSKPHFLLKKTDDVAVYRYLAGELKLNKQITLNNSDKSKIEYSNQVKYFKEKYPEIELNDKSIHRNSGKIAVDLEYFQKNKRFSDEIFMLKILKRVKKQLIIEHPESIELIKNYFQQLNID